MECNPFLQNSMDFEKQIDPKIIIWFIKQYILPRKEWCNTRGQMVIGTKVVPRPLEYGNYTYECLLRIIRMFYTCLFYFY